MLSYEGSMYEYLLQCGYYELWMTKALIILCVVSLVSFMFSRVFPHVFYTTCWYQKREERREKITQREPNASPMFLYYTMRWVKAQAFCICFSRFGTFEACNNYQNAKLMHSVIMG